MNPDLIKTASFAAVALVLTLTAFLTTRPRDLTAEEFTEDQGQPFFAEFDDPRSAAALEVVDFNPDTAEAVPFKVEFEKDKGWVIPSHHDYPADAKDRLAKTAAGVIDLKKDFIVSDDADQHEELGVIDPLDTKSTSLKGRGKRVTLKDQAGKVLADLIIGKAVRDRTGQRFVRVPGQKRTYGVNLNVDLTARFNDWIETNLLKLDSFRVVRFSIDNHKVDPEAGRVEQGDRFVLERKDSSSPWTIDNLPPDREVDTSKVSSLTSALADLKIVGVRPKPPGLTAELKATAGEGGIRLSPESQRSLQYRGFYVLPSGRLLSNHGDIFVATDEGIVYALQFGEVTVATGEALTAGSEAEDQPAETKKDDENAQATASSDNRYLFVRVQFDPDLIPKPKSLQQQAEAQNDELPANVFARSDDEIKSDEDQRKRDQEDYDRKIEDGKKKAKELTDRFAGWYYVVPGDAFRKIVVDRAALTREKGTTTTPAPAGLDFHGLDPNP